MKHCKIILRRLLAAALALAILCSAALAASTGEEFYQELEQNLRAQSKDFTITFSGTRADLHAEDGVSIGVLQRNMMVHSPDSPDSADYCGLNLNEAELSIEGNKYHFVMEYLCTQEELDEVDRRAEEIVRELNLDGLTAEARIKLIYEYVCTHFVYDNTATKFSAYDGLTTGSMVCQGYAILMSKLLWAAGVPNRIAVGRSQNQTHAWNIVELDGLWYNLDATWDSAGEDGTPMNWTYFLKSDDDFTDHFRFPEYEIEEFFAAHPFAAESREPKRIILTSGGSEIPQLVVRKGIPVTIDAELPEGANAAVQWSSSDSSTVSVNGDGGLEGQKLGSAVITADLPGDPEILSAKIAVHVVDLSESSPWAYDTVTRFYLDQLLPYELCGGLRDNLTRAQLSKLCYHYIGKLRGWETAVLNNPFSDIKKEPFSIEILRCNDIGLMTGVSSFRFDPGGTVTREQAATVVSRLIGYLTGEEPSAAVEHLSYRDGYKVSDWAFESVAALSKAKLFQGAGGLFRPQEPITLQEMIALLDRVHAAYPDVPRLEQEEEAES